MHTFVSTKPKMVMERINYATSDAEESLRKELKADCTFRDGYGTAYLGFPMR